jgi:hypothetical protein
MRRALPCVSALLYLSTVHAADKPERGPIPSWVQPTVLPTGNGTAGDAAVKVLLTDWRVKPCPSRRGRRRGCQRLAVQLFSLCRLSVFRQCDANPDLAGRRADINTALALDARSLSGRGALASVQSDNKDYTGAVATAFADLGVEPGEPLRYSNRCATLEACCWRVRCIEEDSLLPFPLPPSLHHSWEQGWRERALSVQHPPRNRRDPGCGRRVN